MLLRCKAPLARWVASLWLTLAHGPCCRVWLEIFESFTKECPVLDPEKSDLDKAVPRQYSLAKGKLVKGILIFTAYVCHSTSLHQCTQHEACQDGYLAAQPQDCGFVHHPLHAPTYHCHGWPFMLIHEHTCPKWRARHSACMHAALMHHKAYAPQSICTTNTMMC
jgi:hypothetical protein